MALCRNTRTASKLSFQGKQSIYRLLCRLLCDFQSAHETGRYVPWRTSNELVYIECSDV
jgi:hypothetical protein